jgi:hypothetical protein
MIREMYVEAEPEFRKKNVFIPLLISKNGENLYEQPRYFKPFIELF